MKVYQPLLFNTTAPLISKRVQINPRAFATEGLSSFPIDLQIQAGGTLPSSVNSQGTYNARTLRDIYHSSFIAGMILHKLSKDLGLRPVSFGSYPEEFPPENNDEHKAYTHFEIQRWKAENRALEELLQVIHKNMVFPRSQTNELGNLYWDLANLVSDYSPNNSLTFGYGAKLQGHEEANEWLKMQAFDGLLVKK